MNQQTRSFEGAAPVLDGHADRSIASRYRIALGAGFLLAVAAALFAGRGAEPAAYEPQLVVLVRFMALIKLGVAIGAAALVAWRLGRAPNPRLAAGYTAGTMLMAAGPALMWHMHHIILGSVLFYAGLVLIAILARGEGASRLLPRANGLPPARGARTTRPRA